MNDEKCNQKPNQSQNYSLAHSLESFSCVLQCRFCNFYFNDPKTLTLVLHHQLCPNYNTNQQVSYHTNNQIQMDQECDKEQEWPIKKQNLMDQSLQNTNLICKSTKMMYKKQIEKFLQDYQIDSMIEGHHIMEYLRRQKPSTNLIHALLFYKKIHSIVLTNKEALEMKQMKKIAQSISKQNYHNAWNIDLIQKFINDLTEANKGLMAFRIFILYNTSARVSELSQITFGQVLSGTIKYIPKKQMKCGKKAERNFLIDDQTIQITQIFMNRNNIAIHQTLNIGNQAQTIKSHSIINELKRIKKQLMSQQPQEEYGQYQEFLKQFKFHDLRFSSLQECSKSGVNIEKLRKFLGHSSLKVTERYLINNNEICDVKSKQKSIEIHKFQQLDIKFKGHQDIVIKQNR